MPQHHGAAGGGGERRGLHSGLLASSVLLPCPFAVLPDTVGGGPQPH